MRAVRSNRFRMSRLVPWVMNRNPSISASLRPGGHCSTIRSDLTNLTCLAGTAPSSWLARSGSEALASRSKRRWYGCERISNRGHPAGGHWVVICRGGVPGALATWSARTPSRSHSPTVGSAPTARREVRGPSPQQGCLRSQRDAASGRLRSTSLSPVLGGYSSPVLSLSES